MSVTICIAAVCPVLDCVMCTFDALVSSTTASADVAMKLDEIREHGAEWLVMFAGYSPRFKGLVERTRGNLAGGSLQHMIAALEEAYKVELLKRIETEILMQYGCTRDDFIDRGRAQFGDVRFSFLLDKIDEIDLEISLMVVGFDSGGASHLLQIDERGIVMRCDQILYHAIGTGRSAALGALHQNAAFSFGAEPGPILYKLCAAKFAAENAPRVGRMTFALIARKGGVRHVMRPEGVDKLREMWWEEGLRPVSDDALKVIRDSLASPTPPTTT